MLYEKYLKNRAFIEGMKNLKKSQKTQNSDATATDILLVERGLM